MASWRHPYCLWQWPAQPRTLPFADDRKIWEMAKRGGFTLNIAGRQELEAALRKGVGGIWLDLTREQHAKLRSTARGQR